MKPKRCGANDIPGRCLMITQRMLKDVHDYISSSHHLYRSTMSGQFIHTYATTIRRKFKAQSLRSLSDIFSHVSLFFFR